MDKETSPLETEFPITLRGQTFTLFYPIEALWAYEDETGASLIGDDTGTKEEFSLSTLAQRFPERDASELLGAGKKLKGKVEKIMVVNNQNKMLLENSLRFVKRSLRIITQNYEKKLIDTTM